MSAKSQQKIGKIGKCSSKSCKLICKKIGKIGIFIGKKTVIFR